MKCQRLTVVFLTLLISAVATVVTRADDDKFSRTTRPLSSVWDSAEAQEDCAKENGENLVQASKAGVPLSRVPEPEVCREAKVANLTRATRVKVLGTTPRCGDMVEIIIASGRYTNITGCIKDALLTPEVR